MKRIYDLIGSEHDLAEVARELKAMVREHGAQGTGAFEITCADESEHECTQAFERVFAHEVLPRLKYGERVPFRLANPGARYEWGSVRIAEDHFATDEARRGFKVVVIKINGHCAVTHSGADGVAFGRMVRYGGESTYCGAIHALFAGSDLPFALDLAEDMRSEGVDRVAMLLEPALEEGNRRALFGALASARLQARRCALDIQDHTPAGPTVYVVMHGVTLNKEGPDGDLVGGVYVLDHRTEKRVETYRGLGDDPSAYRLRVEHGRVCVEDDGMRSIRDARDHRAMARTRLRGMAGAAERFRASAAGLLGEARSERSTGRVVSDTVLKGLLLAAAATSPVAAALLLVAEGAVGIHHAMKLHQAVDAETQGEIAREVVEQAALRVEHMPEDAAERLTAAILDDQPAA